LHSGAVILAFALAIKEQFAPDSLNVATSLNSLGAVSWDKGDSAAALDYYTRSLALRERLAPVSLDTAVSLNSLGGVALKQGRAAEALPLFTRAVEIIDAQFRQIDQSSYFESANPKRA
jgi:tetratricopeptide (TPR) repeat protein